jgi:phosphatidylglycerophosphatase A
MRMTSVARFIATAGYVGYAPVAPGTFGSMAGLAVFGLVRLTGSSAVEWVAIALSLAVGTWAAGVVERQLGKDPGPVVIDEVLGMLVTLATLDVTPVGAVVGFFVFRALDIVKPFPAGRLERLHGGPGIMLDDLMAGVYGNLVMRGLIAVAPGLLT